MTPQEKAMLDYVRSYVAEHEFSPSFEDCSRHLKLVSCANALRMARSLASQGYITMSPGKARSMRPVNGTGDEAADALVEEHGVYEDDEHPDKLIICSREEALATLRRVLAN